MKCSIYKDRPDICKRYPEHQHQPDYYKSCSYTVENGIITGECNQCGECCFLEKDIHKMGKDFVKGDPCPFLRN
jgi:hypothetical protein